MVGGAVSPDCEDVSVTWRDTESLALSSQIKL